MEQLDQLPVTIRLESGDRYISSLNDCDFAIGNHLATVLHKFKEVAADNTLLPFEAFTKRDIKQKLYLAKEPDPRQFLRQLRQRFFSKDKDAADKYRNSLPVVYFHRVSGGGMSETGNETFGKNSGIMTDDEGTNILAVDEMPVTANYQVYVLAWDDVTLNKLRMAVSTALSSLPRDLEYNTLLAGYSVPSHVIVSPGQALQWDDMSLVSTEERLLVNSTLISTNTLTYQARAITETSVTVTIERPMPFYSTEDLNNG